MCARARVCVCVLCKLGYCVKLSVRCNSPSKSKSPTAALMPAASQVMKGPVLVATDTFIPSAPSPLTVNQSLCPLAALYP